MTGAPRRRKILIVEDDLHVAHLVQKALIDAGYQVVLALSGEQGLASIRKTGLPDLAMVDIGLPGMNGFQFCEAVHEFSDLPIIFLTGVSDETTVVGALKHFAEDFVAKPFRAKELMARIDRVLRRRTLLNSLAGSVTRIDDYLGVDFAARSLIREGQRIALTPTETKLLHILVHHAGTVLPSRFLLGRIWPGKSVDENALRVNMHHLRKKIQGASAPVTYISTEKGVGYSFHSSSPLPTE